MAGLMSLAIQKKEKKLFQENKIIPKNDQRLCEVGHKNGHTREDQRSV